ncbi:MAG: DEAD/DEAH box helicase [Magnetococcus sp. THC-1_WYH]
MSETPQASSILLSHLHGLSDPHRKILQLVAIAFDVIPASLVVACLKKLKIKQPNAGWFSVRTLQPYIESLIAMGLLKRDLDTGFHFRIVPTIADAAVLEAVADGVFADLMRVIEGELPSVLHSGGVGGMPRLLSFDRAVREIRLGLLTGDEERVFRFLGYAASQRSEEYRRNPPLVRLCAEPWDLERMAALPLGIQVKALEEMLTLALLNLDPVDGLGKLLEMHRHQPCAKNGPELRALYMIVLLIQGRLQEAVDLLANHKTRPVGAEIVFKGWIDFLKGKNRQAIATLDKMVLLLDDFRLMSKHNPFPYYWGGLFLLLGLLKQGKGEARQHVLNIVQRMERNPNNPLTSACQAMRAVALARGGDSDHALLILGYRAETAKEGLPWLRSEMVTPLMPVREGGWNPALPKAVFSWRADGLPELFRMMALYWIDHEVAAVAAVVAHVTAIHKRALAHDYPWVAMETAALLGRLTERDDCRETQEGLEKRLGFSCVTAQIQREERWEQTLSALMNLLGRGTDDSSGDSFLSGNRRLVWLIETHGHRGSIQAREQTLSDTGEWSRGKALSARRLHGAEIHNWGYLTPQDIKICAAIRQEYIYNGTRYDFDWAGAMLAMVGHPQVYWLDNPTTTIEVIRGEPELLVNEHNGRVRIRFAHKIEGPGVLVLREGERRCRVIEITGEHHKIADILGPEGFNGPETQKGRVMGVVARLANLVTIQSTVDVEADGEELAEVEVDSRPRLQLVPNGAGLSARLLVRPLGTSGPWSRPGKGSVVMFAERDGQRVKVRRDFQQEKRLVEELVGLCPALAGRSVDDWSWTLGKVEDCLELLAELQEAGDKVVVEWPEGERFRLANKVTMDRLQLKIRRERDWFAVSGTLTLDDALVLEMGQLLKITKAGGRFIPLGNGQFAALTEAFRKRLAEMLDMGEEGSKGWKVHALTSPWLKEMAGESGRVVGDKHWKEQVARLDAMESGDAAVPSTFQAELREYQIKGFQWLHRLSVWGVGGCLADDMGLGKTLQAMALLLHRAPDGAGLVVAPTSVCTNWEAEIKRFAPTLNPVILGGPNRAERVSGLKAFDVLIVSYALLQIEEELLGTVIWNTIVLDEAQAIKNRMTKRSRAAMALQGHFRLMTTGTPIENHLGELWNLFRFLNPGLLGSLERFNERFAIPIERFRDREASQRLKTLIRPFILRRTKNQVLQELPPLTEIVLHVEMGPEESAFYESLRQRAMAALEGADDAGDGQNHLAILAELMTLRRACCNSRLVQSDLVLPSAKLETFKDVARTLLDNRHKALVFSQFVGHLTIIREFLVAEGISFQYLDGSTPVAKRKESIDAFQSGVGDFFLISLKAGGVGLNLTAADYVIHMDPWWNPAVEDQASNRAHRFGQRRPVTVYRLVTRGTIEEKIVELHAQKRDLADDLLEGGDMSGRLSAAELLGLIRMPLNGA